MNVIHMITTTDIRLVAQNVVWRGFETRMKAPTGVGSGEGAVPPPQKNVGHLKWCINCNMSL